MMDCYRTHKTSRTTAVVLAIPMLILVLLIILIAINDGLFPILIIALPLLYLVRYLLAQNFVTVCLGEHDFLIKKVFFKKEQHLYSDIREIVLISLPQKTKATGVGVDNRVGEALGRTLVNVSENANQNSHRGKQLAIKFNDNTITTLNSNYIIDGNVLLEELARKAHVRVKEITGRAFRDWKKRDSGTHM